MSACSTYWFPVPVANRGHWREVCGMAPDTPLYLELGCGKGDFAVGMAQRYPDICYVALEKDESVILEAIENAAAGGVTNLFFLWTDVALLNNFFAEEEVNRKWAACFGWRQRARRPPHVSRLPLSRSSVLSRVLALSPKSSRPPTFPDVLSFVPGFEFRVPPAHPAMKRRGDSGIAPP